MAGFERLTHWTSYDECAKDSSMSRYVANPAAVSGHINVDVRMAALAENMPAATMERTTVEF
jgi:hypothetical protein